MCRDLPRWLTTDQAQRLTGLGPGSLYRLKKARQIHARRRRDGSNLYLTRSLQEYVESAPEKQGRRGGWYPERLTGCLLPEPTPLSDANTLTQSQPTPERSHP